MDWLRRNWPDLLIGVALVAVIAGIIATLISGGSFFPVGQGGGSTPTPQPTTPVTGPTTPGTTTPQTTTPAGAQPETADPETGGQAGGVEPGEDQTADGAGTEPAGAEPAVGTTPEPQGGDDISVLPPTGAPVGTTQPEGSVTALPPAGSPAGTTPTVPTTTTVPSPATPSTPVTPATPASANADDASYRVSVGAFGNADNAQRLAQQFQDAGYPVLLGTQGSLTIVLVGPYATEDEARVVANQVNAGNFGVVDPTVYRYVPEEGAAVGATTAAPAPTTTPATPAAAQTAPAAAPATSAAGRYLQVGAYANRESSLPQRDRLEELGFTVTEVQEGTLLKLLVGPYQGAALNEAQSRLAASGIENFARGL